MNGMQFSGINRAVVREPRQQRTLKVAICSRCCSNFFNAFRTVSKNLTVVWKRRRQLKKKLFILFWISFSCFWFVWVCFLGFFFWGGGVVLFLWGFFCVVVVCLFLFSEIESHNKYRYRPRRDISKQRVVGNALNINPSCLKVRLKRIPRVGMIWGWASK